MNWANQKRQDLGPLRAIITGEGPTFLFLHGVGLRAEAWNAQIAAFSHQHRVIAVDLPGHGDSNLSPDTQSLRDFTDAIAASVDEPALVVGHSMGAMIALDLALRHPERVRGVAALNAIFRRSAAAAEAVKARAAALDGRSPIDPSATLHRWFGSAASPELDACQKWLEDADPAAYRAAYRIFAQEDGPRAEALATLACPALFMTGAEEPNSTPEMSMTMADLAPRGRLAIVEGAAHMMPMTHASEVNAALGRFAEGIWA